MVFCPIWQADSAAAAASEEETHRIVTAAAEGLLTALAAAERRSGGWADQTVGYALVDAALTRCLTRLAATGHWGRANQLPSDLLWKIAGPTLAVGSLQHRARTKPWGYAGDFQLQADIVLDRCCDHPLGRLFDRYFLNQAAPQAVRNRTQQAGLALADHLAGLTSDPCRVVSVGVGTGMDVCGGLSLLPPDRRRRVQVTLLDLDEAGLQFAGDQIGQVIEPGQIQAERENLFRLARPGRSSPLPPETHFLICSGLFDYLEDDVAAATLQRCWECLAADGLLLVGNFVPQHPTRAYMEWIGNWYLHYRSPTQLAALATAAGIPSGQWTIQADRTGADLFLRGWKGEG